MATGTENDYEVASAGAGLIDRTDRGKIAVRGADAVEFLQGQVTNDIEALEPGTGCYAALLDPKAKMLADMRVLMTAPDELLLDTEPEALDAVLANLRMYKIGRQVEIEDVSAEWCLLALIGAKAAGVADRVEPPEQARMVATEQGLDIFAPAGAAESLRSALLTAGAVEITPGTAELIRIEHGIPRYGVDMNDQNLPGEAGIVERAVSFEKGCYVGQEPVARMFHKGRPNRHLRGLQFTEPVEPGSALLAGDREVGRATSTGVSPQLGPIGLGILRREVAPGDELDVSGSAARATVIELPFRP